MPPQTTPQPLKTPPTVQSAFDNIWGSKAPSGGVVNSRANEIRALAKANIRPEVKPDSRMTLGQFASDYGKGLLNQYGQSATDILGDITKGAENISSSSNKGLLPTIGATAETGLNVAGDTVKAVFAPITQGISTLTKAISTAAGSNPTVQAIATNPAVSKALDFFNNTNGQLDTWAQAHPQAAKDLSSALNVGMAIAGESVGINKPTVGGVARTAKTALSDIGTETGNIAEKALESTGELALKAGEKVGLLKTPTTKLNELAQATKGVAEKGERIGALEQTGAITREGAPVGGVKQTLGGGIKVANTAEDIARAKSVEGIVKPKSSPVKNLTNLNKEISRISKEEVEPALEKAGSITPISSKAPGWSEVVQRMNDIKMPDLFTTDSSLEKTYNLIRQRMIEQIKKSPPSFKGLWKARQEFDKLVKDQFGDAAFNSEKNGAIKRGITDMRRAVNEYIGEKAPEYKPLMDKLTNMYDARYNIAEQFQNIVNKGGIRAFKTINPKTYAALKWGIGGGLTAAGAGYLKGKMGL